LEILDTQQQNIPCRAERRLLALKIDFGELYARRNIEQKLARRQSLRSSNLLCALPTIVKHSRPPAKVSKSGQTRPERLGTLFFLLVNRDERFAR
jgi:hypothetical protein